MISAIRIIGKPEPMPPQTHHWRSRLKLEFDDRVGSIARLLPTAGIAFIPRHLLGLLVAKLEDDAEASCAKFESLESGER